MKLFKNFKLNSKGFSHIEVVIAIVVIVGIAAIGVKVLNISHADPLLTGTCKITKVPAKVAPGVLITPTVKVTNTGASTFTTNVNIIMAEYGRGGGDQLTFTVKPGKTVTTSSNTSLADSVVGGKMTFTATSTTPAFSCTAQSTVK